MTASSSNEPVDLRQVTLSGKPPLEKLNLILRSFQLAYFTSALSIVSFMLIGISKLIIRENTTPDVPNPSLQLIEAGFNMLAFIITIVFVMEIFLQIILGQGLSYLVNFWSLFDVIVVLLLLILEVASRAGWNDPSSGIWRFLTILRMAHLLYIMSRVSKLNISKKRAKRREVEDQIAETQTQLMEEEQRCTKLRNEIRSAANKLKGMEKTMYREKMDADVYIRRYSAIL